VPAPRLVDVKLEDPETIYREVIENLERLVSAGLVHGDLSQFNILLHGDPVFIDFSQSIPSSHPFARELLQRDVKVKQTFLKS